MLIRYCTTTIILQMKHTLCSCQLKLFSVNALCSYRQCSQINSTNLPYNCTNARHYHCTPLTMFWEKDMKGGYPVNTSNKSRAELVREGLKELKKEIKLWKEEVKEKFDGDHLMVVPGEIDTVVRFGSPESLEQWVVTSDSDHNEGFSTCQLTLSSSGKGLFQGNICSKVPEDGRIKKAGYCNMKTIRARKSFKRDSYLDWQLYTHLVLRVRGDGRSYIINLATTGYYDIMWNDVYNYILFTRGGPYWQETKIPFSKFFLSSKGRIQDKQNPIPLDRIASVGFSAGDQVDGPFRLEIDYVGIEYDPTHTETFAYELYKMPQYIVGV